MIERPDWNRPVILGRTGLTVGRLGVSSSFGAPAPVFEECFERGCNYFTWGTFIKGRSSGMKDAVRNIVAGGGRDRLVMSIVSYAHSAILTRRSMNRGLVALGLEYADVLLLGYFSRRPPKRVIDGALRLKEEGLIRWIGITSHQRKLFPELYREGMIDVYHFRYNAAHRGAEEDIFPRVTDGDRPGMVSFTATAWKRLLKAGLSPSDCYRFVLSNPNVDVCMMGAAGIQQARDNMAVLNSEPLSDEEMERIRSIGDEVHYR